MIIQWNCLVECCAWFQPIRFKYQHNYTLRICMLKLYSHTFHICSLKVQHRSHKTSTGKYFTFLPFLQLCVAHLDMMRDWTYTRFHILLAAWLQPSRSFRGYRVTETKESSIRTCSLLLGSLASGRHLKDAAWWLRDKDWDKRMVDGV